MDLSKIKSGMNVRAYVPLTNSAAFEVKGTVRAINDGRVAIDFKNNDNVNQTVEVRPIDVLEVL